MTADIQEVNSYKGLGSLAGACRTARLRLASTPTVRIAGLDLGGRRIGVAVSDALGMTAQPLGTVDRVSLKTDLERIREMLAEYTIERFVAGLPLLMDGTEGEQAGKVRRFCDSLEAATELPVSFQDERLSSVESKRLLSAAGAGDKRGKQKKGRVDRMAAALILQSYLDRHSGGSGPQ